MIIIVSDNNLKNFEKKLMNIHKKYDIKDVDIDIDREYGIYIARFFIR